jgi:formamidopyrimidine-DNA glycosylase
VPELPEIEVLRRSLLPRLVGDAIAGVEVHRPALREPLARRRLARLEGQRVTGLRRRGKYLLIDCDGGSTLLVHLGMSGRLTLVPGGSCREPHEHLAIHLVSGRRLRLRDPRRFGLALVVPTAGLDADPHLVHLGVEPLDPAFSGRLLADAARGRRGPVKALLMDARVVAGVGNIYASEALFAAGIHPRRSVARIAPGRWQRLAAALREVLERAIAQGGTTLADFADGEGREGSFQVALAVYGREGEPCPRCRARLRRTVQAGRSTFYCPGCQR